jgi:hypothetical protein
VKSLWPERALDQLQFRDNQVAMSWFRLTKEQLAPLAERVEPISISRFGSHAAMLDSWVENSALIVSRLSSIAQHSDPSLIEMLQAELGFNTGEARQSLQNFPALLEAFSQLYREEMARLTARDFDLFAPQYWPGESLLRFAEETATLKNQISALEDALKDLPSELLDEGESLAIVCDRSPKTSPQ